MDRFWRGLALAAAVVALVGAGLNVKLRADVERANRRFGLLVRFSTPPRLAENLTGVVLRDVDRNDTQISHLMSDRPCVIACFSLDDCRPCLSRLGALFTRLRRKASPVAMYALVVGDAGRLHELRNSGVFGSTPLLIDPDRSLLWSFNNPTTPCILAIGADRRLGFCCPISETMAEDGYVLLEEVLPSAVESLSALTWASKANPEAGRLTE